MGSAKRNRKFGLASRNHLNAFYPEHGQVKRIISQIDARLKENHAKGEEGAKKADKGSDVVYEV